MFRVVFFVSLGVSIIIPCWNHRHFLARALNSSIQAILILKTEDTAAEVIVVDDASRDGSVKYVQAVQRMYEGLPIVLHRQAENRGPAAARNTGARLSRYRYLVMLDADNALVADKLSLFVRSMQETRAAMVYGLREVYYVDGSRRLGKLGLPQAALFKQNYIDTLAMHDKHQLLAVGGFTENRQLEGYEDWELNMRLLSEDRLIVMVPESLGQYYHNYQSLLGDAAEQDVAKKKYLHRVFDQNSIRSQFASAVLGREYHPDRGYLS